MVAQKVSEAGLEAHRARLAAQAQGGKGYMSLMADTHKMIGQASPLCRTPSVQVRLARDIDRIQADYRAAEQRKRRMQLELLARPKRIRRELADARHAGWELAEHGPGCWLVQPGRLVLAFPAEFPSEPPCLRFAEPPSHPRVTPDGFVTGPTGSGLASAGEIEELAAETEEPPASFRLRVEYRRTPRATGGRALEVEAAPGTSVAQLMVRAAASLGSPLGKHRLVWAGFGEQRSPDVSASLRASLEQAGIGEGAKLALVRGAGPGFVPGDSWEPQRQVYEFLDEIKALNLF